MTEPSFFEQLAGQRRQPDRTPAVTPGINTDDAPIEIANPQGYVDSALDRECAEVAETHEGGRNHRLNAAAFSLARLVAAGLPLDEDHVVDRLTEAAERAGLTATETAKTIRSGLIGGARHPLAWTPAAPPAKAEPFIPPDGLAMPVHERERTSWWPRSGATRAEEAEDPPPTLLRRTDGVAVAYAGKVNALIGESESGKTWIALEGIRQVLADGGVVGMLDFEDSYGGIKTRLGYMGVPTDALDRFFYCSPDESLTQQARDDLAEFLVDRIPALVVVDGVNAAMTLLGFDLGDNTDATKFTRDLLRPLTATGAGVITVDHVTKNRDGRGNYAIGAQAKRADINGAAILVEVIAPFGRGMTGRLKLTVSKDRPGHVRAAAAEAKHLAEAVVASTAAGDVKVDLYAVTIDDVDPVMEAMELVSRHIETTPQADVPNDMAKFAKDVGRRKEIVVRAVDKLILAGHITHDDKVWELIRPYRRRGPTPAAPFVPTVPERSRPFPEPTGQGERNTVPPFPSLQGNGNGAHLTPDRDGEDL